MQKYVPEADDEKKSIEILSEVLAQVIFMFLVNIFISSHQDQYYLSVFLLL